MENETRADVVALARKLRRRRPKGGQLSLRWRVEGTGGSWLSERAWQTLRCKVSGEHAALDRSQMGPVQTPRGQLK